MLLTVSFRHARFGVYHWNMIIVLEKMHGSLVPYPSNYVAMRMCNRLGWLCTVYMGKSKVGAGNIPEDKVIFQRLFAHNNHN